MGAFILHDGATINCLHAGQARPATTNSRVKVSNQPITTLIDTYTVSVCANPTPPVNVGPCVTAQFLNGAIRVRAGGSAVLTQASNSICIPTGTTLAIHVTQTRVTAT